MEMNKFLPYLREVKNPPKSGYTEDQYVEEACEQYESTENKEFNFRHVIEYLSVMPKFDSSMTEAQAIECSKETANTTNNNVPIMGGALDRPMGSKKAKDLAARTMNLEKQQRENQKTMSSIAQGQHRIADSLTRNQRFQDLVERAKFLERRGKLEEAEAVWDEIEALHKQNAKEDKKAAKKQRAKSPTVDDVMDLLDSDGDGDDDDVPDHLGQGNDNDNLPPLDGVGGQGAQV